MDEMSKVEGEEDVEKRHLNESVHLQHATSITSYYEE